MLDLDRPAIETVLARYDQQRVRVQAKVTRARWVTHFVSGVATLAIAVIAGSFFGFGKELVPALILPLLIVGGIWLAACEWAMRPAKQLARAARQQLYPLMLDCVESFADPSTEPLFQIDRLLPRAAIGPANDYNFEIILSGSCEGTPFQSLRARLHETTQGEGPGKLLFAGTILAFGLSQPFDGTFVLVDEQYLFVGRESGFLTWLEFRPLDIALPNPAHRVQSDNPVALAPRLHKQASRELDRLYEWQGRAGAPPRIALAHRWGFVLVPDDAGLRFELPDTSRPMSLEQDVRPVAENTAMLLGAVRSLRDLAVTA